MAKGRRKGRVVATDGFGRTIDYLRISVTDKCNYRCRYCMPADGVTPLGHADILSIEEIVEFVRIAATEGIAHIRLTGGEPLVRRGIVDLVRQISALDGIESLALTTNAVLLPQMADELKAAGLSRVNISLDTFDPEAFAYLTRTGNVADALAGIDKALEVGFDPVKVNCVVIRSLKQDFLRFARMTVESPISVRFIEFMPVGEQAGINDAGWNEGDVIPSDELCQTIARLAADAGLGELAPADPERWPQGNGPASYYQLPGAQGSIGFISSRSNHFCSSCNRLRLTADGFLRPCLFSDKEFPVKEALRTGSREGVIEALHGALREKPDEHHDRIGTERNMSKIGG